MCSSNENECVIICRISCIKISTIYKLYCVEFIQLIPEIVGISCRQVKQNLICKAQQFDLWTENLKNKERICKIWFITGNARSLNRI